RGIVGHGVNCQGAMGSGVAAAIRYKWPKVYSEYKTFCDTLLKPREALGIVQTVDIHDELIIANCFTQLNYGRGTERYADPTMIYETISGLVDLSRYTKLPVYIPRIGCGLGGLSWVEDVFPLIERADWESRKEYGYDIELFVCDCDM
ncbi:MAG: macro domain-containing protein, partial [Nitrososphaeraceae archaeon]